MQVNKKDWRRPAASGQGEIFSRLWAPEAPKAVLMIAHGMAEHSARYDEFATWLAGQDWAVCMNDHAGHGRSAIVKGHFADENGWEYVLGDLHALLGEVSAMYQGLPLFLMGHSMGTFMASSDVARWGESLTAAIFCGTMGENPALGFARLLANLQIKFRGPKSRGRLIDKLSTGSYYKKIRNPVNKSAWLSTDEANCVAYEADPDCGFEFTAAGYRDLFTGLAEVNGPAWPGRVPKNLPVFVVAGGEDPVGSYGKGPTQVAEKLRAAGVRDVTLKLYPGKRHELLNETNKAEVYADLRDWLDTKLPG